jgi:hypothetical protein
MQCLKDIMVVGVFLGSVLTTAYFLKGKPVPMIVEELIAEGWDVDDNGQWVRAPSKKQGQLAVEGVPKTVPRR